MIKKTTVLILYLLFPFLLFSQNLSTQILAPQASVNKTETMIIDWVLGDSFIETISHDDMLLTQGFLQPELQFKIPEMTQDQSGDLVMSIYPNPAISYVNVKVDSDLQLNIKLFDANGRLLSPNITTISNNNFRIETINLPTGMYILKTIDSKGLSLESYKIIKF